jgi:hypothetical protein
MAKGKEGLRVPTASHADYEHKDEINKIPKDLYVRISVVNFVTSDNTQSTQWELGG